MRSQGCAASAVWAAGVASDKVASGTVSAFVEATLRKPTYADFMALRDDVQHWRGWWRNRVARILLNFFLTSLGTAIGVWLGGAQLIGKLFG